MSEKPAIDPASPAGQARAQLLAAVQQFERASDLVYSTALSTARLLGLSPPDIPRLCVTAACRTVERMIESYQDRRGEMSHEEAERRKIEILGALQLLIETFQDGLLALSKLSDSLGVAKEATQ